MLLQILPVPSKIHFIFTPLRRGEVLAYGIEIAEAYYRKIKDQIRILICQTEPDILPLISVALDSQFL